MKPGGNLTRTPMPPRTRPLGRGGPLESRSSFTARVPPERAETKRKRPRDTGFPPAVKLAVRTRAGNGDADMARCECCAMWLGRYGGEVQHRVARKSGGRGPKAPGWVNHIVNAALLCGSAALGTGDHGRAERREADMGEDEAGFWIKDGPLVSPALVPVMLHGEQGGITVWLAADGSYAFEPPGEAVA